MDRRNTRSNSLPREGSDAQFWAAQPDPSQIERGHVEAVALTRAATRTAPQMAAENRVQGQNQTQGRVDNPIQDPQTPEEGQQDIQMRTSAMEEGTSFSTGDISTEVSATSQERGVQQINAQYRETPAHYTTGTPTETDTPGANSSKCPGRLHGRRNRRRTTKLPSTAGELSQHYWQWRTSHGTTSQCRWRGSCQIQQTEHWKK